MSEKQKNAQKASGESSPPVLQVQGVRATLRLNRRDEHNRLDPLDLNVLRAHLEKVDCDPAVRMLVLTGTGTKTFCSGYTISALRNMNTRATASQATLEEVIDRLERLRMPTVCALNGSVYGGGVDLALACDFRIGVTGSRLVMPAAKIGLHYYASGMRRCVERLGAAAAKKLFLLGEPLACDEMLRIGYLDELVAPEVLSRRVEELAAIIAANAPAALAGMKAHINRIAGGDFDAAAITRSYKASLRSRDLAEGLAALGETRTPKFQGK